MTAIVFTVDTPLQEAFSPCEGFEVGKLYLDGQKFICLIRQPANRTCGQLSFPQFIITKRANHVTQSICADFASRRPLCDAAKQTFTLADLERTCVYIQT